MMDSNGDFAFYLISRNESKRQVTESVFTGDQHG